MVDRIIFKQIDSYFPYILSSVLLQVEKPRVVSSRPGEGTTSDSTSGITVDVDEDKQRVRLYYLSTWFIKGSVK